MDKEKESIERSIAGTVTERPIGFSAGGRHFFLYPPTLGKTFLLSEASAGLEADAVMMKANPFAEALRLCMADGERIRRIIALHTMRKKTDLLDERKVKQRMNELSALDPDELAELWLLSLSWESVETFVRYFGIDKEREQRARIARMKGKDGKGVQFGGRSVYGTLIDFACQRYGWTMDYVLWSISYANLQMLMADAPNTVFLSKEEMKKLRIPQDSTFVSADDVSNIEKIKAMGWN